MRMLGVSFLTDSWNASMLRSERHSDKHHSLLLLAFTGKTL